MSDSSEYIIALLAEGTAEEVVLDILLDTNKLKFSRDDVLKGKVLRCRSGQTFSKQHLDHSIGKPVRIYRVLDSKKENFKIARSALKKVSTIDDYLTTPEIEMFLIIYFNDYDEYRRKSSSIKPSEYAKAKYSKIIGNIKGKEDLQAFWTGKEDELVQVINKYARLSPLKREETIAALLK